MSISNMLFSRKSYPELISIHIPKTAGTSFRNILKSVYGENQVVRFDIDELGVSKMNELPYIKNDLPQVSVIHGHFYYEMLKQKYQLPENYKIISWVRDPVQRVLSNFYYLESVLKKVINEEKRNLNILSKLQRSLIEYARTEINRNRQSKFLNGNLPENFDFIGIHEFFEQEVSRLSAIMSWKNIPEVLYHNKTLERSMDHPPEILREIRELNMLDVELYSKALQIRNDKMNA